MKFDKRLFIQYLDQHIFILVSWKSLTQGIHLVDSAMFSTTFSRSSIYCWPFWTSNKYLAGPIRPANDPLILLAPQCQQYKEIISWPYQARDQQLARWGQQEIISWPYWVSQIFIVGHNLLFKILHVNSTKVIFMVGMMLLEFTNKYICLHTLPNAEY